MQAIAKRLLKAPPHKPPCLTQLNTQQLRFIGNEKPRPRRRRLESMARPVEKSEWWAMDGEMHEIGDNVPPRERFVIPSNNVPQRRRKMLREQFMRRTRLVVKEDESEPFCRQYMQLYNELRENWERLYWDAGYSKQLAVDHADYDSPEEDDDEDFSPYRRGQSDAGRFQERGLAHSGQAETWQKVNHIRDRFEIDRERRMKEKAFAPINVEIPEDRETYMEMRKKAQELD